MTLLYLRWILVLGIAFLAGGLIKYLKLPSILGWLITGMVLGPYAIGLLSRDLMNTTVYNTIINWMQIAFGLMLGTELVWSKIKSYGRALVITTITQSVGTFLIVSAVFAVVFAFTGVPVWLGLVFGSIALATAPAPALSICREFHTQGPVTDTLLPMSVLDDIVGIVIFFSINAMVSKISSGSTISWTVIPLMIFLPILIGLLPGFITGLLLRHIHDKRGVLTTLLGTITMTYIFSWWIYTAFFPNISANYMLAGVTYATVFSNMISETDLQYLNTWYNPILTVCLLATIVNLGAPLDYHMILGAGLYTFIYIAARACGKYCGARFGATITHLPETVQKYLGLTLLPHSGVSLVFTGIICSTLAPRPDLAQIVQGTIAAAAIINEIIAVIAARKGFQLAGEIHEGSVRNIPAH